ncbi:hypothetical protein V2J09_000399 [Rumex salicifolius]
MADGRRQFADSNEGEADAATNRRGRGRGKGRGRLGGSDLAATGMGLIFEERGGGFLYRSSASGQVYAFNRGHGSHVEGHGNLAVHQASQEVRNLTVYNNQFIPIRSNQHPIRLNPKLNFQHCLRPSDVLFLLVVDRRRSCSRRIFNPLLLRVFVLKSLLISRVVLAGKKRLKKGEERLKKLRSF